MERTKLGLGVLGAALILGILGDSLLRATPWGINAPLWVAAMVVSAVVLARLGRIGFASGEWWLAPLAVLYALFIAWRAAPMLVFLNVSMVLVALSLAAIRGHRGSLKLSGISEYVLGSMYAGLCALAGPIPIALKDIEWQEVVSGRWRSALAVTKGVLIAAPLLLIFGGLFVAADEVFEGLMLDVFRFNLNKAFGHLLLAGFFAWISAGALRLAFLGREPSWISPERPASFSLGAVELGTVLILLNVLFLSFVAVQISYLFGGLSAAGLTYAEYARRGFFELVTVTALVLPLLLLAHWLLRPESRIRRKIFNALAGLLLVLLLIIVASALYRMWLYLQAFGLTEMRFYATAFILWLVLVLSWFAVTVLLRDRREHFAYGTLISGFAAVMLLNVINPDGIIARVNVSRLEEGKRFDPYYLTTLSSDAAPVLVEALPAIGDEPLYEQEAITAPDEPEPLPVAPTVREAVVDRYLLRDLDWRSWNVSRRRGHVLVCGAGALPDDSPNRKYAMKCG